MSLSDDIAKAHLAARLVITTTGENATSIALVTAALIHHLVKLTGLPKEEVVHQLDEVFTAILNAPDAH